jgi:hypothetical protein
VIGHDKRLAFILCSPRSGSTLLTAALGCNPGAYALPELGVLAHPSVGDHLLAQSVTASWTSYSRAGLLRAVAELVVGSQSDGAIDSAQGWLEARSSWSSVALLEWIVARTPAPTVIEKSPEHARAAVLSTIGGAWPDARLVHLVRHPFACITSMVRHFGRITQSRTSRSLLYTVAARRWVTTQRELVTALEDMDAASMLVRFEALLAAPHAELAALASWLELPDADNDVQAMLHTERWPYAWPGPRAATGGGDDGFLSHPRWESDQRIDVHDLSLLSGLVDNVVLREVRDMAQRLGYPIELRAA